MCVRLLSSAAVDSRTLAMGELEEESHPPTMTVTRHGGEAATTSDIATTSRVRQTCIWLTSRGRLSWHI